MRPFLWVEQDSSERLSGEQSDCQLSEGHLHTGGRLDRVDGSADKVMGTALQS
jgi:hypothetical protein